MFDIYGATTDTKERISSLVFWNALNALLSCCFAEDMAVDFSTDVDSIVLEGEVLVLL